MSSLNVVHIEGILGIDAIKNERNGVASVFFTLGSSRSWKDKDSGEWQSRMTWVPVVNYRSTSDKFVSMLTKSTPVRIRATLESYSKEVNGQTTTVVQLRCDDLEFLPRFKRNDEDGETSRRSSGGSGTSTTKRAASSRKPARRRREPEPVEDDDEDEGFFDTDEYDEEEE